jgi:hypothetical protein
MSAVKDGLASGVAGTSTLVGEVTAGVFAGSFADVSDEGFSSAGSGALALVSELSAGGAILDEVRADRAVVCSEGGGLLNRHIVTTATVATTPMTIDIQVSFFMSPSFLCVSCGPI